MDAAQLIANIFGRLVQQGAAGDGLQELFVRNQQLVHCFGRLNGCAELLPGAGDLNEFDGERKLTMAIYRLVTTGDERLHYYRLRTKRSAPSL